ncbi:MAG: hypothetical protein ACREMY_19945, partial [bacterium]
QHPGCRFGSWAYVPSACAALSDWRADVIGVEAVNSGDPGRVLFVGGFTRQTAARLAGVIVSRLRAA